MATKIKQPTHALIAFLNTAKGEPGAPFAIALPSASALETSADDTVVVPYSAYAAVLGTESQAGSNGKSVFIPLVASSSLSSSLVDAICQKMRGGSSVHEAITITLDEQVGGPIIKSGRVLYKSLVVVGVQPTQGSTGSSALSRATVMAQAALPVLLNAKDDGNSYFSLKGFAAALQHYERGLQLAQKVFVECGLAAAEGRIAPQVDASGGESVTYSDFVSLRTAELTELAIAMAATAGNAALCSYKLCTAADSDGSQKELTPTISTATRRADRQAQLALRLLKELRKRHGSSAAGDDEKVAKLKGLCVKLLYRTACLNESSGNFDESRRCCKLILDPTTGLEPGHAEAAAKLKAHS